MHGQIAGRAHEGGVIHKVDGVNQQIGQIDRGAAGDAVRQRDRAARARCAFDPDDGRAGGGGQCLFERTECSSQPQGCGGPGAVIKEFPTRNFHIYLEKIGMRRLATQNNPGPMDTNHSTLDGSKVKEYRVRRSARARKVSRQLALYVAAISLYAKVVFPFAHPEKVMTITGVKLAFSYLSNRLEA